MQAIVTKYIGPTKTKGARIKATSCGSFSVTVPFDYEGNEHEVAARELCKKLKWEFSHVPGELPDGSTAWVFVSRPKNLSERIQSIAQGETWNSSDLHRAMTYCQYDSERESVLNYLKGDSSTDDRFRLQTLAMKIPC
jgi:hypothetical protein